MRALVTGGAGFIGSHLTEALLERGDEVVCVERPGATRGWIEDLPVEWHPVGIENPELLARRLGGVDVVFHLAALTEARTPDDFYRVNTLGTARVIEAIERAGRPRPRFLLLSSIAALGPCRNGEPLGPTTVPFPRSHYGNSKLLAEAVVHAHAGTLPATIIRFPSVYGPRERAVFKFFQLVKRGTALTVGRWDREVSMIYVGDAVQGLIAAATSDRAPGRTYLIAHPEIVTWRGFAEETGQALETRPVLLSVPEPAARCVARGAEWIARARKRAAILNRDRLREMTASRWVCDPSRAISEIGFEPRYPLRRGVPETADWYRRMSWL